MKYCILVFDSVFLVMETVVFKITEKRSENLEEIWEGHRKGMHTDGDSTVITEYRKKSITSTGLCKTYSVPDATCQGSLRFS